MTERWSLRQTLLRDLMLGLSVCWLAGVGLAALMVRFEMHEVFDSILQETAQHLLPDILREHAATLAGPALGSIPDTLPAVPHDEYITYQVLTSAGEVRLRSHQAPEQPYLLPPRPGFAWDATGRRVYTEASVDGRYAIQIAEPAGHRREAVLRAAFTLLPPLAALLPVAAWLIRRSVRRGLDPVLRVQQDLAGRGGHNLAPLRDDGLPAELLPLVADTNQLLLRLARTLESERSFAANSAHELRTPVAAALAQSQLLAAQLGEASPEGARALGIAAELRRLGRLAERLLQLSRVEGGGALARAPFDLLPLVHLLLEDIARQPGQAERLHLEAGDFEEFQVLGDLDAYGIALRNLLENALLHGDPAQPVTLRLAAAGQVSVSNGGAVLPPAALAELTRPFTRHSQAAGSGLGLAIVAAIMRQAGGGLDLHSPIPGREDGFQAVLRFPLA